MIDEGLLVARIQSQFNKETTLIGKIELRYFRGAVKKLVLHTKPQSWVQKKTVEEFITKELLPFEVTDDFSVRFVEHMTPPPGAEFAEEKMKLMKEEEERAAKAEARRIKREKADLEAIAKRGVAWKFEV